MLRLLEVLSQSSNIIGWTFFSSYFYMISLGGLSSSLCVHLFFFFVFFCCIFFKHPLFFFGCHGILLHILLTKMDITSETDNGILLLILLDCYKHVPCFSSRKPPYIILTPLNPSLYSKTWVYRGIHYFSYFCSKT